MESNEYWTNEKLMERMKRLGIDKSIDVTFGDESIGSDLEKRKIMMAGPRSYESPQWFVLCFLYEFSHFLLMDMIANKDNGAYADMMKRECQWRKEFWCWNNTMDLAYSIFGLRLDAHLASMIHKCLNLYEEGPGFEYNDMKRDVEDDD